MCTCRVNIEELRTEMELAYTEFQSFTDPIVLDASRLLDDALTDYRNCPCFEKCNQWGSEPANDCGEHASATPKSAKKKIAG
ncbi:Spo0E family sporulation regulatory protein-aspartic acid phosphatase [Paenibacillus sp. HB172176]|uniref:Spo0E family sporulation regulatory protein-aspartic acid phosphatase n=1 Tax=Paenibacillus sp. HB172176 TaxID=2493690 RepID=UPI001439733B|nr:Spo0E family sporulation regulatory protein-aspartic acid phosphatase [Paenibacillus sp. HB172176]